MVTSELRTVARNAGPQGAELLPWRSVPALAVQEARNIVELLRGSGVALPPHEQLLRLWQAGWQRKGPRAAA